jgi:hypothetical protein
MILVVQHPCMSSRAASASWMALAFNTSHLATSSGSNFPGKKIGKKLLPTFVYLSSSAISASIAAISPITSRNSRCTLGSLLQPATSTFCTIPIPPTARRNQVFVFTPAAVTNKLTHRADMPARHVLVTASLHAYLICPATARSSRLSPLPFPRMTIAC